jgi:hypothetical protein
MAATALPIVTPIGSYPPLPVAPTTADFVFTAGDNVNGNSFVSTGREIVIVHNGGASAGTVTFTSVADGIQRTGDITAYSVGVGLYSLFGPFTKTGWTNTSGLVVLTCSAATMTFAVIRLPSIA